MCINKSKCTCTCLVCIKLLRPNLICLTAYYARFFLSLVSEKVEVLSELVNPINITNYNETQACHPRMESLKNFSSYVYMCNNASELILDIKFSRSPPEGWRPFPP